MGLFHLPAHLLPWFFVAQVERKKERKPPFRLPPTHTKEARHPPTLTNPSTPLPHDDDSRGVTHTYTHVPTPPSPPTPTRTRRLLAMEQTVVLEQELPLSDLLGIAVGHVYHYAATRKLLRPPAFLKQARGNACVGWGGFRRPLLGSCHITLVWCGARIDTQWIDNADARATHAHTCDDHRFLRRRTFVSCTGASKTSCTKSGRAQIGGGGGWGGRVCVVGLLSRLGCVWAGWARARDAAGHHSSLHPGCTRRRKSEVVRSSVLFCRLSNIRYYGRISTLSQPIDRFPPPEGFAVPFVCLCTRPPASHVPPWNCA